MKTRCLSLLFAAALSGAGAAATAPAEPPMPVETMAWWFEKGAISFPPAPPRPQREPAAPAAPPGGR
ncbi:MAG: hypothetical protein NVS2B9_14980 [Myxococcales bacterium]